MEKEWLNEPNAATWYDRETGYKCHMLRNYYGAWCGYVRVPKTHRFYGRHYQARSFIEKPYLSKLTFKNPNRWTTRKSQVRKGIENTLYAHGGITFAGRPRKSLTSSVELKGHWFGFDCSHLNDYVPGFDTITNAMPSLFGERSTYRNYAYVRNECEQLAKQLKRHEK